MNRWLFILFLLNASAAYGSIYYVRTDGNDDNLGTANTAEGAWLTITKAETVLAAGDNVYVQSGVYDYRVAVNGTDGTADAWINYVAQGTVVVRGFDVYNDYTRIIGFEITHASGTARGISLNGTCSHVELIDNNIHDVGSYAIHAVGASAPTYITIRGNQISYPGRIAGVSTNISASIANSYDGTTIPTHWLVEYNTVYISGDFCNVYGTNHIVRNNYFHKFSNALYRTDDSYHCDMFQPGSGGVAVGTRRQVYERNVCADSLEANSHFGIWQDTVEAGDTNIIIRGNVGYNLASGVGVRSMDKVTIYANTFYNVGTSSSSTAFTFYKHSASSDYPLAGMCSDNIIHTCAGDNSIYTQVRADIYCANNLGYLAAADDSYVSTSDPLFINAGTSNFHLQSGSPARNLGTNIIWITSDSGSGTSFAVNDSQLICDGFGMVDGDTITVGKAGTTTTITNINWGTQTIYVKDSVTWTNGMPVYWGTDTGPDIGALPYGSMNLTSATIIQSGTTYTVTPVGDCRGVWFYVDGIPTTWDSTSPYSATIASGTVTAKAYALYAQIDPVVTAQNATRTMRATTVHAGTIRLQ